MACGKAPKMSQTGAETRPHSVGVARYWLRAALPHRWRTWLVLGLLVGLVSGGVLMALASARRADTAYERFLDDTNAWDVAGNIQCDQNTPSEEEPGDFVGDEGAFVSGERRTGPPSPSECLDRFRALPSVADLTLINQYGAQFTAVNGHTVQPTSDIVLLRPGGGEPHRRPVRSVRHGDEPLQDRRGTRRRPDGDARGRRVASDRRAPRIATG